MDLSDFSGVETIHRMPPRAIVLTFDRLSRRCLGCYGHEWIETPNLDRLAARAVVFDQHFLEFAEDDVGPTHAWWRGSDQWSSSGVESRLLVECANADAAATRSLWPTAEIVAGDDGDDAELEQTPFTRLIGRGAQLLKEFANKPATSWLLWLKSRGISWPCVARPEFAELYADELTDANGVDVDSLQAAEVAYAACVTQLDHGVGRLLARIERLFGDDAPLLIVTAAAGESLGEAESLPLSHVDSAPTSATWRLRDEIVHTPLLIAHATLKSIGSRRQELVQSADLAPTLAEWFGRGTETSALGTRHSALSLRPLLRNEEAAWRESLVLRDCDGNAAMRTRDFYLVEQGAILRTRAAEPNAASDATGMAPTISVDDDESICQLFVKPEDLWEVNDVAAQQMEQVVKLRETLHAALRTP
jgi:sulfatase-like protein